MVELHENIIQVDFDKPVSKMQLHALVNVVSAYAYVLRAVQKNDPPLPQAFLQTFWGEHERMVLNNKMLAIDEQLGSEKPDGQE